MYLPRPLLPYIFQLVASWVRRMQHLFIIGAPRSGTTWLQSMLGSHPRVATTVELTLFDRYLPAIEKVWREERELHETRGLSHGLGFLWSEEELHEQLRAFAGSVYSAVAKSNPSATHLLDKRPYYAMHVAQIAQTIPGARFIHIVRDGRDVAISMMALWRELGWLDGTVRGSARQWRQLVCSAREADRLGFPYLEVRYEDLLSDGANVLRQVLQFSDLEWSDQEIRACVEQHGFERMRQRRQAPDRRVRAPAQHYRVGIDGQWRDVLSPRQGYAFESEAGDLLRTLGYAEGQWWAPKTWYRYVLPLFAWVPFWREIPAVAASVAKTVLHPALFDRLRRNRLAQRLVGRRPARPQSARPSERKESQA